MTGAAGAVSAVIVSYHTGAILDACLDAALSEVDEIVLVDNGNPDDVAAALRARAASDARITLLQGHGNVGFARGCNLGAAHARGAFLLFLNPDVVLSPGAAAALRAARTGARGPAIIGGRLVDKAGAELRGARRDRLTLSRAFANFTGLTRLGLRDMMRHRDPTPAAPIAVGSVSGALMFMSRADFDALGGFDEGYFLHVEDFDICRRAEESGGGVLFAPAAQGLHTVSSSVAPAHVVERHKARGFARYFRKFAHSPGEKLLAMAAGGALRIILPLRARLRRRPRAPS